MNPLLRSLSAFASVLLSLLAALGLTGFLLLFTETGTRWLAEQARMRLPGLEWTALHGTLAEGLRLEGLNWAGADSGAHIDTLRVTGEADCLWRLTLCISGIEAAGVRGWTTTTEGPLQLPTLLLPIPLETGPVRITDLEWRDGPDAATPFLALEQVRFRASMYGRRLQFEELRATQAQHRLRAEGDLRFAHPWPLHITASLETGVPEQLQGLLGAGRAQMNADLQGSLETLRGDLSIDAEASMQFAFEAGLLEPAITLRGKLQIPSLELGSAQAGASLTAIDVLIDGSLTEAQVQASAQASRLTLAGAHRLPAGTLQAQAHLGRTAAREITLQYTSADAASTLRWQGQLAWPDAVSGSGRLQFHTKTLSEWAPGLEGTAKLEVGLNGHGNRDGAQVDLDIGQLAGNVQEIPFDLRGALTLRSGADDLHLDVRVLSGRAGAAEIQAQGTLAPALDLAGRFQIADLQRLDDRSHGSAKGDFRLLGPPAMPRLQFEAQARDTKYGSVQAARAALSGSITLQEAPQFELQARLDELTAPPVLPLTSAHLHAAGTPDDFRLKLSATGPGSGVQLNLTAAQAGALQETRILVTDAHVYAPSLLRWDLDVPASLTWDGKRGSLRVDDDRCLAGAGGRLCLLAGSNLPAAGDETRLRIDSLRPSAWHARLPPGLEITGTLEGDAQLNWSSAAPALRLRLEGGPGALLVRPVDGRNALRHVYSRVRLAGEADAAGARTRLHLASESLGDIEARLSLARDDAGLEGHVRIQGLQLAPLRPLLPALETLSGQFDAELELGGSRTRPRATGSLRLSGAQLGGPTLPLQVSGLQMNATVAGDSLAFDGRFDTRETEEATAGGQTFAGQATINGQAHWGGDSWRVETALAGEQLQLQIGGHTRLQLDGRIETIVSPELLQADGTALVRSGRIRLPRYSGEGIALAEDVVLIPAPEAPPARSELPFARVKTSLALDLGEQLEFSGFGVDGWLVGKVNLTDLHAEHPRGQGRIQVKNGRYRAYGQRLKLRRGNLDFRGDLQEPWIDAEAVRPLDSVVAGVRISGPASEPLVTLFSEPSMPDEEILSWLVLGKPLGTGTAKDSQILSAALLSYGLRGGEGVGERIADRLGISQFEVGTTTDSNGSGVYASGYLSPRLFVRYGITGVEAVNNLKLRYRLFPRLFLEASSGLESAVDLLYSFSF